MRFHELRYACAILLLTKGVLPKIASEMRRHPSIMLTLDTYSHMLMGLGDTAVKAMEEH